MDLLDHLLLHGNVRTPKPRVLVEGLEVEYVTLTSEQEIDVSEEVARFRNPEARNLAESIGILARAIVTLNGSPLILDPKDAERLKKDLNGREPGRVDMARDVLLKRIPHLLINVILEGYWAFYKEAVTDKIEEAKKKLTTMSDGDSSLTSCTTTESSQPTRDGDD